jgi:hypothetical protein
LKRSEKTINADKAIHMAALISDLWNVSKKYIQRELRNPDVNIKFILNKKNELEVIRIRTKASYEYIIT